MLLEAKKLSRHVFLVLLLTIFGLGMAMADDKVRSISVTGMGKVSLAPDTAWVSSGVKTQAATAAEALKQNNRLMEQVIEVYLDADIDKKHIQTSGFNVRPVYDYSRHNKPPTLTGYEVSNTLIVKITKINKLGELLDEVIESGSNQISGIRFGFADEEALLDKARAAAVSSARNKAELYADAADVDIGEVISISETGTNFPNPVYHQAKYASRLAESAADSAVPVLGGEQEISATVTVVYELEN